MRKKNHSISVGILVACFLSLQSFTFLCQGQVVEQPGLPFEIRHARLESSPVTKESYFDFTLANHTDSPLVHRPNSSFYYISDLI